jgi:hypothetical protein
MVLGKCFPIFCYRSEASLRTRVALSFGMCPRGEVGAGVITISLGFGIEGPAIAVSVMALALNLLCSSLFIMLVKVLAEDTEADLAELVSPTSAGTLSPEPSPEPSPAKDAGDDRFGMNGASCAPRIDASDGGEDEAEAGFRVGDRVLCYSDDDEAWYNAEVTAVDDGAYTVTWLDDGSTSSGLAADYLHPVGEDA